MTRVSILKSSISTAIELYKQLKNDLTSFNDEPRRMLPMPDRYFIGRDGVILYSEVNPDYTHRPEPEEMITVFRGRPPSRAASGAEALRDYRLLSFTQGASPLPPADARQSALFWRPPTTSHRRKLQALRSIRALDCAAAVVKITRKRLPVDQNFHLTSRNITRKLVELQTKE